MMRIGGPPATDEARLLGDISAMLSIANMTSAGRASAVLSTQKQGLSRYRKFCRTYKIIQP
jgi:hypothetical protein